MLILYLKTVVNSYRIADYYLRCVWFWGKRVSAELTARADVGWLGVEMQSASGFVDFYGAWET